MILRCPWDIPLVSLKLPRWCQFPPDWPARRYESFGGGATWLGWDQIQKNPRKETGSRWFKWSSKLLDWHLHSYLSLEVVSHCELSAPTSWRPWTPLDAPGRPWPRWTTAGCLEKTQGGGSRVGWLVYALFWETFILMVPKKNAGKMEPISQS